MFPSAKEGIVTTIYLLFYEVSPDRYQNYLNGGTRFLLICLKCKKVRGFEQHTEVHANGSNSLHVKAAGLPVRCHFGDCPVNGKSPLLVELSTTVELLIKGNRWAGVVFTWALHGMFIAEMESCHSYPGKLLNRAITAKLSLPRSTRHFQSRPNNLLSPVKVNEITQRS